MRTPILAAVAVLMIGGGVYVVAQRDDESLAPSGEAKARGDGRRGADRKGRGEGRRGDGAPQDDASLEARVAKLEQDVGLLRRQLALGAVRRSSGGSEPELAEQLDDPRLDSTVRDIVADERDRERSERWQRRSERALDRVAEAVDLTEAQQTAITALWGTERDQLGPLFVEARSGERDFDEVIQEVEALRAATDVEAGKILSEAQLESYLENRPRGPGGRGPGGRGAGGDGGRDRGDGRGVGPQTAQGNQPTPK